MLYLQILVLVTLSRFGTLASGSEARRWTSLYGTNDVESSYDFVISRVPQDVPSFRLTNPSANQSAAARPG